MALHAMLWTKPPTPYFRPPPIHLCVVGVVEQSKVVVWDFNSTGVGEIEDVTYLSCIRMILCYNIPCVCLFFPVGLCEDFVVCEIGRASCRERV